MPTEVCKIGGMKQTLPLLSPFFLNLQRELLHISISDQVIGSEVSWKRLCVQL
jgi:hypothetical protein